MAKLDAIKPPRVETSTFRYTVGNNTYDIVITAPFLENSKMQIPEFATSSTLLNNFLSSTQPIKSVTDYNHIIPSVDNKYISIVMDWINVLASGDSAYRTANMISIVATHIETKAQSRIDMFPVLIKQPLTKHALPTRDIVIKGRILNMGVIEV